MERLNMVDILICRRTGKSMLCCSIRFKRCRTCRSQLRCWTCGRRGTFSISWEWRARSKGCGQSSDRSNRTGRRSSTKTFRYALHWSLTLEGKLYKGGKAVKASSPKMPEKHSNWKTFIPDRINKGVTLSRQGQNCLKRWTCRATMFPPWIILALIIREETQSW